MDSVRLEGGTVRLAPFRFHHITIALVAAQLNGRGMYGQEHQQSSIYYATHYDRCQEAVFYIM